MIASRKELLAIQRNVRIEVYAIYKEWANEMNINLVDFAHSEVGFSARAIGGGLSIPSKHILEAAIRARPFQTKLLREALSDFTQTQTKAIKNAIAEGFYQGRSNAEIIRSIRGTKAANYKDGLLNISKVSASRITRTAINHTASTARMKLLDANKDIFTHYKIVATLDSRTSDICDDLNGDTFEIGKGRLPPFHPNCRTTITPVLD
ncbi:MAG: hypothetical protein GY822_08265 [Deltaproteobacteria bacterium]|nr:hypothetical protein [Deltaproteobacteria bacterium]